MHLDQEISRQCLDILHLTHDCYDDISRLLTIASELVRSGS